MAKNEQKANIKLVKILLAVVVSLTVLGAVLFALVGLSINKPELFVPTTAATTTTKSGNSTDFSIGQNCRYNKQCPQNAFCSGTCQCSLNYYYNQSTVSCLLRKTNGASCTTDDECNIVIGLECSTSGTCKCDAEHYWNSTYVLGGGIATGRCQNKKVHGMYCPVGNEGVTGVNYVYNFNSQIRRCFCEDGWAYYHDIRYGKCRYPYKYNSEVCNHNWDCHYGGYSMCMDTGDGVKRCIPIPIRSWYGGYYVKFTLAQSTCNRNTYKCNEFRNLVCYPGNGTCICLDEYYYWNTTMCVLGSKYGEACSSSSQCVPSTAGFVCDYPYSGALQTVCRCTSGTRYFDLQTDKCIAFKTFNSTCRDNTECSGSPTDSMFCGHYSGGSQRVCLCTDAYHASGSTCVAKLAYNTACSSTAQCMDHLDQICLTSTTGKCGCVTGRYYDSSDFRCKHMKYQRDNCTLSAECWSGTCTTSLCT